jgi:hypothetical protein
MQTLYILEDHIMKVWSVADELETIRWMLLDREVKATDDELDNAILGIHTLLNARLEMLFDAYEKLLQDNFHNMKVKDSLADYIDRVMKEEESYEQAENND